MTIDIRTDIPADIHPGVLAEHENVLNQANTIGFHVLKDGLGALSEIYSTLGKLHDATAAWDAVSPKTNQLVRGRVAEVSLPSKDLIAAAERAFDTSAKFVDRQTTALNRHVTELETRVASAITDPYAKTPIGAVIRQHVKGLKDNQRMDFVRSLITAGKKSDVAAVLDAPGYLSGLNDETHTLVREMAAEAFAPWTTGSSAPRARCSRGWSGPPATS